MTETTRSMECSVGSATLFVAFELGSTKWVMAMTTPTASQRPRLRQIAAGDVAALHRELLTAKARLGLGLAAPVRSCYEAGRDGFWLHRWLTAEGIANVVVDSSSIEVNRRARQAKTDRLDAVRLLELGAGGGPGLECGARAEPGGGSGAATDAGDHHGARGPDGGAQSYRRPVGDAGDPV